MKLSILICTKDRKTQFLECLRSIAEQTRLPEEIIVIEEASAKSFFSQKFIEDYFHNKVSCKYFQIKSLNIAVSRNLAVKAATYEILLFVDDDVTLSKDYCQKLINIYEKENGLVIAGGRIKSKKEGYWAKFWEKLFTSISPKLNSDTKVLFWPNLNMAILKSFIYKKKIFYDERFTTLEDIDFCLRVRRNKGIVKYYPILKARHYYRNNILVFLVSFWKYYRRLPLLIKKHPTEVKIIFPLKRFSPKFLKQKIFYPFFIISQLIDYDKDLIKRLGLTKKYYFAGFLYGAIFYFSSVRSRK